MSGHHLFEASAQVVHCIKVNRWPAEKHLDGHVDGSDSNDGYDGDGGHCGDGGDGHCDDDGDGYDDSGGDDYGDDLGDDVGHLKSRPSAIFCRKEDGCVALNCIVVDFQ